MLIEYSLWILWKPEWPAQNHLLILSFIPIQPFIIYIYIFMPSDTKSKKESFRPFFDLISKHFWSDHPLAHSIIPQFWFAMFTTNFLPWKYSLFSLLDASSAWSGLPISTKPVPLEFPSLSYKSLARTGSIFFSLKKSMRSCSLTLNNKLLT